MGYWRWRAAIGLCAGLLATAQAASAQPAQASAADFDRAERVFDDNLAGKLKNGGVEPHWTAGGRAFWYRRDGAAGPEYRVVDAASGRKSAPFDPARLAAAVSAAVGSPQTAAGLKVSDISAASVRVTVAGRAIVCALPALTCAALPASAAPADALPSPDGGRLLFARASDLWLRDVATGAERRLTSDGEPYFAYGKLPDSSLITLPLLRSHASLPPFGISWSPDGRTLVGGRVDERAIAPYPYVEWVPQDGGHRPVLYQLRLALLGDKPAPTETFVIDVASGEKRMVRLPDGWSFENPAIAWSADGRLVFGLASTFGGKAIALVETDTTTGAARLAIRESSTTSLSFSSFVYDGSNVRILDGGRQALWWSERDGWGHLYLYDVASGRMLRQLTAGDWLVLDVISIDEAHRRVFFTAGGREPGADPYYRKLYSVSLDGGPITALTPQDGDHDFASQPDPALAALLGETPTPPKVSPDGRFLVDTVSTVDQPAVTVLRDARDGRLIAPLEHADASAVYAAGWRAPTRVKLKAADGVTDLYAVVWFPPGYRPDGRYPVIDAFYGGPQTISAPRDFPDAVSSFPVNQASLAQLGFIVTTIDARATPGRSKAFQDVGYGDWADPEISDHIAAIKALAARFGGFDLDRVGVYGHSFGGYTSARAILSHPEFYKVAVSSAGPQNYQGFYQGIEPYNGLPDYGGGQVLRPTPQAVPAHYAMLDNASLAGNLSGKLMLVYGDVDENALPAVTLQLADALEKHHKVFDLVYLPNQVHSFVDTSDYFTRLTWSYFLQNLAGVTPPPDLGQAADSR